MSHCKPPPPAALVHALNPFVADIQVGLHQVLLREAGEPPCCAAARHHLDR